jgi:hypothetical protein
MGKADTYKHGTYNAICDTCGFKFKADQLQMTWDGFFVCDKCYEPRHPQDFVRAKLDRQRVPIARPDADIKYNQSSIGTSASRGDSSIHISDITYTTQYIVIEIQLDDSSYFVTRIAATPLVATAVKIEDPLPFPASAGNTIIIHNHADYLATNEVTAGDL